MLVTIRIQSRTAGSWGRVDKSDLDPIDVGNIGDIDRLHGLINSEFNARADRCMGASINNHYVEQEAIIIEFTRGYAKLDDVADAVESALSKGGFTKVTL